jgi:hypothetical protein
MVLSAKLGVPSNQYQGLQDFLKAFWTPSTVNEKPGIRLSVYAVWLSCAKLVPVGEADSSCDPLEVKAFW